MGEKGEERTDAAEGKRGEGTARGFENTEASQEGLLLCEVVNQPGHPHRILSQRVESAYAAELQQRWEQPRPPGLPTQCAQLAENQQRHQNPGQLVASAHKWDCTQKDSELGKCKQAQSREVLGAHPPQEPKAELVQSPDRIDFDADSAIDHWWVRRRERQK